MSVTGTTSTTSAYTTTALQSASTSAATESKMDFLNLLTMQLKSQNPLQPYNNQEFASQLAQFSQLDQLTNISGLLEEQSAVFQSLSQTMTNSALPGMLGKETKANWNTLEFDGTDGVKLGYDFETSCSNGELYIMNSSGTVVRTVELSGTDLTSGGHSFRWDGKDNDGNVCNNGEYTFAVSACTSGGETLTATPYIYGTIEAVRFTSDGTMLVVNGSEIPLSCVADISVES